MKSARRFGLGGRRRGSRRRETLVTQVGFFIVGVIAVVLMGEFVENQMLFSGSSNEHSMYRSLQENNASSARGESESITTTAFSNSTTQNSCGLTWAFDEWAYVFCCAALGCAALCWAVCCLEQACCGFVLVVIFCAWFGSEPVAIGSSLCPYFVVVVLVCRVASQV